MRKNVGTLDAYIRITVGLVGLAFAFRRMSRRPYRTPWMLMLFSAMKVAEGITRFCPMLYSMGLSTRSKDSIKALTNVIGSQMPRKETNSAGQAKPTEHKIGQTAADKQTIQSIAQEVEEVLTTASQPAGAAASQRNSSTAEKGTHIRVDERNRRPSEVKSETAKKHRDEEVLHPTH